jgi:diguanylate cyclase (GGDEF)-like protein
MSPLPAAVTMAADAGVVRTEEALESLSYFGLTAEDEVQLARVRERLEPHADRIIDAFYAHLALFPATRALLTSDELIVRLKATQRAYLLSLGDFTQSDPPTVARYFEARIRVGLVHRRVGLAPPLYIGAYAKLGHLLTEAVAAGEGPVLPLILSLQKILHLDSHLAMAAYEQRRRLDAIAESEIDEVTGLLSRRALLRQLTGELARAKRFRHPFSLLFIDADRFKAINDEFGHDTGDAVLRAVAEEVRAATRPEDAVGRYGGDEFLVGLVDADRDTATRVGMRIQERVLARDVNGARATVSIGVVCADSESTIEQLIATADHTMFEAKAAGRNSVRVAQPRPKEG